MIDLDVDKHVLARIISDMFSEIEASREALQYLNEFPMEKLVNCLKAAKDYIAAIENGNKRKITAAKNNYHRIMNEK